MRLSPLSVPYRVVERGGSVVFTALLLYSGASATLGPVGGSAVAALVGLALLAVVAYEVAYYRRFSYDLGVDTLDIHSGVVSRRDREIPLGRIQNVDISRNVVQRALGVAAVNVETAGGSETEASLRFVDFAEAKRLQREVGRLKRGAAETDAAPDTEELFSLSSRELAVVGALAFDFRIPGLLFVLLSGSLPALTARLPVDGGTPLLVALVLAVGLLVVLVSWLGGALAAVVNHYGFRLVRVGDELQYERGLLRRYDGSIPLGKVQTLTVTDDPLKRAVGYASLRVETAGYAPGSGRGGSASEVAIPLAPRDRVFAIAGRIEPFGSPAFDRPPRRVRRRYAARYLLGLVALVVALYGVDAVVGMRWPPYAPLALAVLVPVATHLKWRHRGLWTGEDHLLTRNGFLRRRITVVPYYRVQTVIDSRTAFQRRWGVATVTADTAGSRSLVGHDAAAVDVDDATADALRETLAARLRTALAARRGWTGAPGGDDGRGDEPTDGAGPGGVGSA